MSFCRCKWLVFQALRHVVQPIPTKLLVMSDGQGCRQTMQITPETAFFREILFGLSHNTRMAREGELRGLVSRVVVFILGLCLDHV